MKFETLTWAPIDTEAIDLSVMEPSDVLLLNEYHEQVYEKLSPYLNEEERECLRKRRKRLEEIIHGQFDKEILVTIPVTEEHSVIWRNRHLPGNITAASAIWKEARLKKKMWNAPM